VVGVNVIVVTLVIPQLSHPVFAFELLVTSLVELFALIELLAILRDSELVQLSILLFGYARLTFALFPLASDTPALLFLRR
jgi:hypothetical protein